MKNLRKTALPLSAFACGIAAITAPVGTTASSRVITPANSTADAARPFAVALSDTQAHLYVLRAFGAHRVRVTGPLSEAALD
jgi:hypothetical protein